MKVSRRNLLRGSASSAILLASPFRAAAFKKGKVAGVTQFSQVRLGGGGFQTNIAQSADGTWQMLMGNTPNLYGWYSDLNKWVNLSASPYMDGLGIYPASYDLPHAAAIASDSVTGYQVSGLIGTDNRPGYDNNNGGLIGRDCGQLYKTTDKGQSWFRPGATAGGPLSEGISHFNSGYVRYGGRFMQVDPNNKNVVLWLGDSGFPYITYNGGVTIHPLLNLATQVLPNTRATADATAGTGSIQVASNPILSRLSIGNNWYWGVFNYDHPYSVGAAGNSNDQYRGGDATHITVALIQRNDGQLGHPTEPGVIGGNGTTTGDRIFLGMGAFVAIDRTSTLVANPGIALGDPGIPPGDTCSSVMYFGWNACASPSKVWWTTTACGDLSAGNFAAVPGSPTFPADNCLNRASISDDGVLYIVTNLNNNDFVDRFVHTPPGGSGLSADTWTRISGIFGSGNLVQLCEPDPFTPGRVLYMNGNAFYRTATGYGSTLGTLVTSCAYVAGDAPWLIDCDISLGGGEFSRLTSNLFLFTDGIGTYKFTPNNTGAATDLIPYIQENQSWIPQHMVKTPSPNGNLIASGQDRSYICWQNTNADPGGHFPAGGTVVNGGYVDYARDDPTVTYFTLGTVYRNTNKGVVGSMGSGINPVRRLGNNPFSTVNGSPTVTVASTGHPFSSGQVVGFAQIFDGNGVSVNNKRFTVTVVDPNTYTITASSNANATGSFGGLGPTGLGAQEGQRGWTGGAYGNIIAHKTKLFLVPAANFGGPQMIQYGSSADGGTTWDWQQTLFGGNPLLGSGGSWFGATDIFCVGIADGVIWYLDTGLGSLTFTKTLFRSTDFGATLTCPASGGPGHISDTWSGFPFFTMACSVNPVPGFQTAGSEHVLIAQGLGFGLNGNTPLRRTRDGGSTWEDIGNTQKCFCVARGPGVGGNPYGSWFFYGMANGDTNPRFYRCDDMSASSTACTWKPLDNITKVNVDFGGQMHGIFTDPEVAGRFWACSQDTGIIEGNLT